MVENISYFECYSGYMSLFIAKCISGINFKGEEILQMDKLQCRNPYV